MYLVDRDLKKLAECGNIKNVSYDSIDSVSFDLHIDGIMCDDGKQSYKEIYPGESTIVSCLEEIEMPDDMIGIVIQKNSRLRTGITINSPVYRPGHKTKIFISVTNNSGKIIELSSGESIGAFMIERLENKPDTVYSGGFQNEHEYKGLGNYKGIWDIKTKEIEKKYDSVKSLEKNIYGTVMTILTIFIGIFSLINFEVSFISNGSAGFAEMIIYNLIYVGGIGMLIGFINCILPYANIKKWKLFAITGACFIAAIILMFIVQYI
mgnify:FL=1